MKSTISFFIPGENFVLAKITPLKSRRTGTYFAWVKVNGKIFRQSLGTAVFTTAKLRLSNFLKKHRTVDFCFARSGPAFFKGLAAKLAIASGIFWKG